MNTIPQSAESLDRLRDPLTGEIKPITTNVRSRPHSLPQMLLRKQYGTLASVIIGNGITLWSYESSAEEITPDIVLTQGFFDQLPGKKNGDRVQCLIHGIPFDVVVTDAKATGGAIVAVPGLPEAARTAKGGK